ncbi:heavy metal translocating P-type ATPase [uncultured Clostridium sp.]|uniref:heavy metal translocating P-type ATPase n=1 Tax=uncultured Clostridium sp. TaxID=59620 RepID=UPI0025E657DF|nr:heavy metal translocating P-type ATPase [uncultured Clostridium sp.]
MSKEFKLNLEGLDCANCANKIENRVNKLEEVEEASVNFSLGRINIKIENENNKDNVIGKVIKIVKELEPDVVVKEDGKQKINRQLHSYEHQHCNDGCCINSEENEIDKEKDNAGFFKKNWGIISGIVIYIFALIFKDTQCVNLALFLISYVLVGGKVVMTAVKNISRGQVFDENFLMTIATLGAIAIREYPEAVAVMIFYEIGELFQSYAVNRSRKSITSLMDLRSDYANLLTENGEIKVDPEEINIDDIIVVKPGEKVPLDGILIEGECSLDTSALTGESIPRDIQVNDEVLSGTINLNSVIKMKVTKEFGESTISRILEMVENAGSKKAHTEKFITKFCKYYTPVVVFFAVAIAVIPPLVVKDADFSTWIYRALSFLVVSCPCALVVSVPLGLFSGIGGASRKGILVKGGNYLEVLKDVNVVVFDKTGTLTKGTFKVSEVNAESVTEERLIEIAAMGESFSTHPIAQSIVREYSKEIDKARIKNYTELSGHGIKAVIDDQEVLLGNFKLMKNNNIECKETQSIGTVVYAAVSGKYIGYIVIEDEVKEDSEAAVQRLKKLGIEKVVMLTGDHKKVAEKVGKELAIDEIHGGLLPGDKVTEVEKLLNKNSKGKLIFVGDGINDAPVLARADIGVAMGGIGSDAAIEAADVVLMKDTINSLADAIIIGKKTNKILWQNIIFSLVIKIGVLILISIGASTMWEAVFADVGVTLIAVLNSMRALKA